MQKELLIVGLDPGTTLAYAALDLKGNLLTLESSKNISYSDINLKLINLGRVLVVSTDVYPVPSAVHNFASSNGAKLIFPEQNLLKKEKYSLVKNFKVKNKHQRDALASAIFAYKKLQPFLTKMENKLKEYDKKTTQTTTELALKKEINIKNILDTLNKHNNLP